MKGIIIYTTKYGSVEKAANILKNKINGDIRLVNLIKEKAPELGSYDLVILGGSVYVGSVQKELKKFASDNLSLLQDKKIGLFICGAQPTDEELQRELKGSFPSELYDKAAAKGVFGYEFDFGKLGFLHKLMIGKIAGVKESQFKLSEEKIETFAAQIRMG